MCGQAGRLEGGLVDGAAATGRAKVRTVEGRAVLAGAVAVVVAVLGVLLGHGVGVRTDWKVLVEPGERPDAYGEVFL